MTDHLSIFAAAAVALYAAHHVGDYWIQTDHQARHKGDAGRAGRMQCTAHVLSYVATQAIFLIPLVAFLGLRLPFGQTVSALAVSGVTHYLADRREHGLMFWLARRLPGKDNFLKLGTPRPYEIFARTTEPYTIEPRGPLPLDNPSLGTGAWALDQAWHIFFGVFVAALILAA